MMARRTLVVLALPTLRVLLALLPLLAATHSAAAQRALGLGDDAATLPKGVLRIGAGLQWDRANERYDADGKLRPLGAFASTSSWDGGYHAGLAAAASVVSALSGVAAFDPSLGALTIQRRDASADNLIGAEFGVLSRLTVGARLRAASHAIEPRIILNPGRTEGTMGFNPAWANTVARDRNTLLLSQFDSAVAQTTRRIALCQTAPAAAGCAPIVANVAGAQSLVSGAASFATALNQLYGGRKNSAGMPFIPVGNSAAQQAINQRVLGYRDQFVALGNSALGIDGPAGAALFSPADLATLLSDSLYGYRLRPLRTVHAYGLGEFAVHAKFRLFENVGHDTASIRGFAFRQAVGAAVRVTGGSTPDASEIFAPVTGDAGRGFAVQSFTDLFYGNRFSATIVVGIDEPMAQEFAMRIPQVTAPTVGGLPFPLVTADRETEVSRTPGSRLDIAVTPRIALTRNIRLGATWTMSRQAADSWRVRSLAHSVEGPGTIEADADFWAAGTDWSEQRLALGGTYSTVEAARAGRARPAFDVTYEHQQTLSGRNWRASYLTRDVVTVRWYRRVWGR
ncbi:MAG: hypothetical protein C0497_02250 [Gemmatimonas sp.]|nr:hypothetical protein [Gemmatimonas sp.]